MAKEPKRIDISSIPELLSIAHEVQRTNEPRLLRQDNEDVAILMPIKTTPKRRSGAAKTKEDYEAFKSAAGGWKDIDTDQLIADIYADRRISNRPLLNYDLFGGQ
jgi:hypothetical protein